MLAQVRQWRKNLTRRTFSCPGCNKRLRVPSRPGKILAVSCPRCHGQVQVNFRSPMQEVFQWQSSRGLKHNLIHMHNRFWNLPLGPKIQLLLWLFILLYLGDMLIAWSMSDPIALEVPALPGPAI